MKAQQRREEGKDGHKNNKKQSFADVDLSFLIPQIIAKEDEEKKREYERMTFELEHKEQQRRVAEAKSIIAADRLLRELEAEEERKKSEKKKKDKLRRRRKRMQQQRKGIY